MSDHLIRQAAEIERTRAAEREAEEAEALRRAAERERRKLVHLEPDIERQLTELAAFTTEYFRSHSIGPVRLRKEKKSYGTYRDPDSYEYHRSQSWDSEYVIADAWMLLGGAVSADGTWWWQSEDRQSETRTWYGWSIAELVEKLSKSGECTLGDYRVWVPDEGNGQAVLMASNHAARSYQTDREPDRKLQDVIVEAVVEKAQRHAQ